MSSIRTPQSHSPLEATWRDRVTRWRASGLSVRAFCAREGLSEPSFYSWRRTVAERDASTSAPTAPAFVPVHVLPPHRRRPSNWSSGPGTPSASRTGSTPTYSGGSTR